MAQSDQVVQNATFPAVRADINDNLAALFSQSSGNSAPATTVAFQPWIDTSSSPAVWKVRNATNTGWVTVGTIDAAFSISGVTAIANGGTGQTTASAAINALVPSQAGNADKYLKTDGSVVSWAFTAAGVSLQVFTSSGTYVPAAGKTTFLVFATGGGGGGGGGGDDNTAGYFSGSGAGGGGTAVRLYSAVEMGASATVTIGANGTGGNGSVSGSGSNGTNGGSTTFTPIGTGLAITGAGGSAGLGGTNSNSAGRGGAGGGTTNSQLDITGLRGDIAAPNSPSGLQPVGGASFWAGGRGKGGDGGARSVTGSSGIAGVVFVLEF